MKEAIIEYVNKVLNTHNICNITLLSATNNKVYKIDTRSGHSYIFKIATDEDIDLVYLRNCNKYLEQKLYVSKIIHIDVSKTFLNHHVVISNFLEGSDFAYLVEHQKISPSDHESLARFMYKVYVETSFLKLPEKGYGIYKLGRHLFETFDDFIVNFIYKYTNRILNCVSNNLEWINVQNTLLSYYKSRILNSHIHFCVVSLDTNLKNIILLRNGEIALLNLPILAYSDSISGIGEICSQLKGSESYNLFLNILKQNSPSLCSDSSLILFYETLSFVGKLAFHCREGEEGIKKAVSWGYKIPFHNQILENVSILSESL